jgi:CheY-like chemotaxis protein
MTDQVKPELIICDIQLPKMDGYEVVRRLKADPKTRSIPIIAVTALAMVGDRDRIIAAGFDGYLAKPIDPETFVQEVVAFLNLGHR